MVEFRWKYNIGLPNRRPNVPFIVFINISSIGLFFTSTRQNFSPLIQLLFNTRHTIFSLPPYLYWKPHYRLCFKVIVLIRLTHYHFWLTLTALSATLFTMNVMQSCLGSTTISGLWLPNSIVPVPIYGWTENHCQVDTTYLFVKIKCFTPQ